MRTKAALALALAVAATATQAPADPLAWPAATRESRPWTRWWWLGSAVDEAGLTRELELFARAGLGGVEICPIYGVQGQEARDVPFLSPRWVELLGHALREAERLGLGVDVTTGTGWPFGGPNVTVEDASAKLVLQKQSLAGGTRLALAPGEGRPVGAVAVAADGRRVVMPLTAQGEADWTAPGGGEWQVYVARSRAPVQQVKRAAPGGEGNVLDPFSPDALLRYLRRFDEALAPLPAPKGPRAWFHDSFEYYGASATRDLLALFQARFGYDLRERLPELTGEGTASEVARVRSDYRELLADRHLEYVRRWTAWSHARGSLTRNQAHGSPGDLVDLYAAADIPETEVFRRPDEAGTPRLKLAASAAHLSGRPLVSAEAFTWLGEHFQVSLAEAKRAADWLWLAGVNHLVFHGVPYSPESAEWPGWQFYASVNFGPAGGLWRDLPAFNAYLQRVQSVLQDGEGDEDVLLFYSPRDAWAGDGELALPNPVPPAFEEVGRALTSRGYAWDAVSERFLEQARVEAGRVRIGSGSYAAVLVPRSERMTTAARAALDRLAQQGAAVVRLEAVGLAEALDARLRSAGVRRERMTDAGLWFVRRRHAEGRHYFVVNRGTAAHEGWVALGASARSVARLDPLSDARPGLLPLRRAAGGTTEVRLDLAPGESAVLRTFEREEVRAAAWPRFAAAGAAVPVEGEWSVRFVEGGPVLPAAYDTRVLRSWTEREGEDARRFAGTARYTIVFERPSREAAESWQLDLGDVRESARVTLNGRALGTLFCSPFRVDATAALRAGTNTLEVEVTNLPANRVRDLDQRGVRWKIFRDANVVNVDYKPLDASGWPLLDSGLLGPVVLRPLRRPE